MDSGNANESQSPPSGMNVLDWVVTNYLGAKIQSQHIRNYAGANLALNHGRDVAKKLGLDPAQITPFPSNISVGIQQEQQKPPALSGLAKAGIAAALLASGAGLPSAVSWVAQQIKPDAPVELPNENEEHNANVGFEIR